MRPSFQRAVAELRFRFQIEDTIRELVQPTTWTARTYAPVPANVRWYIAPGWQPPKAPGAAHSAKAHDEHRSKTANRLRLALDATGAQDWRRDAIDICLDIFESNLAP